MPSQRSSGKGKQSSSSRSGEQRYYYAAPQGAATAKAAGRVQDEDGTIDPRYLSATQYSYDTNQEYTTPEESGTLGTDGTFKFNTYGLPSSSASCSAYFDPASTTATFGPENTSNYQTPSFNLEQEQAGHPATYQGAIDPSLLQFSTLSLTGQNASTITTQYSPQYTQYPTYMPDQGSSNWQQQIVAPPAPNATSTAEMALAESQIYSEENLVDYGEEKQEDEQYDEGSADKPYICYLLGDEKTNEICRKAYKRQCDLTKHQNNHLKKHHCGVPGCSWPGGAEQKDLDRHMWTNHPNTAREQKVKKDEKVCPYCPYKGRGDNVARHLKKCKNLKGRSK
ncbi:hypothetical protein V8F33_013772 [Rhypophila sp. PSN 637]